MTAMTDLSLIERVERQVCKVLGSPDHAASVMLSGQDWSTILQGLRAIGERDRLREHIAEQIEHVEARIQDGKDMGPAVWRIALEDVVRENRTALKEPGHEG